MDELDNLSNAAAVQANFNLLLSGNLKINHSISKKRKKKKNLKMSSLSD